MAGRKRMHSLPLGFVADGVPTSENDTNYLELL